MAILRSRICTTLARLKIDQADELAAAIIDDLAREFGGDEIYIPRRDQRAALDEAVRLLDGGASIREVSRITRLSRQKIRLMKR
jgi:Mor family transcriptional regulator